MDDLTKLITTPTWWISTVIVAFLVNIAASYAKPLFDSLVATWSTNRKKRLQDEKERDDAVVTYLIENPQRLVDARTDATYTALRVILALSLAVFWTSLIRFVGRYLPLYELADIALVVIYVYCIVGALRQFGRFRGLRRVIDKCSESIHTYDQMPIDVVKRLEEEENRK
ncbi:MAG: hypothetical protein GXP28_02965 [Planctomycetes bacterium]|nr:hypothetical protein [Planctomycetota bacterium]